MTKICPICGKSFKTSPSRIARGQGKTCSKKCMGIAQKGQARHPRTGTHKNCEMCGKEFYAQASVEKSHRFCSVACGAKASAGSRTGENSPWFKGGSTIRKDSKSGKEYEFTLGTGEKGQVRTHRAIAERALGRRLSRSEVVHHIDGDGLNNTNTNLLVCTRAYHAMLHHRIEGGFGHASK